MTDKPTAKANDAYAEARTMEYVLLGQISGAMVLADKNPSDRKVLESVVHYNKNLWDTWLVDLQHRENRLLKVVKPSPGQLAHWAKNETQKILAVKGTCRIIRKE